MSLLSSPEPSPLVELRVEAAEWERALPRIGGLADRAARAALGAAGLPADHCFLSILLTDDTAIAALNERFRGRAAPTNVLSWPAFLLERPIENVSGLPAPQAGPTEPLFLGDVALAVETVRSEAESARKSLEAHAAHLIVHGVLHLLGYDHGDEDEADVMAARERAALSTIGVADPYA